MHGKSHERVFKHITWYYLLLQSLSWSCSSSSCCNPLFVRVFPVKMKPKQRLRKCCVTNCDNRTVRVFKFPRNQGLYFISSIIHYVRNSKFRPKTMNTFFDKISEIWFKLPIKVSYWLEFVRSSIGLNIYVFESVSLLI